MNIDHADSLLAFAHHYLPREMGVNRAEMTDATPDGIHLRVFTKSDNGEGEKVLIPYPAGHNVSHARCLRKVTVAMHAEALEGLGRLYRLRFYSRKRPFHYAIFACSVVIMILTTIAYMIGIQSVP